MDPQRLNTPQTQASPSGEDHWFAAKGEEQYGPVAFGDLARFARQGVLLGNDWVWRTGLDSWIPAADVPGLFNKAAPHRREPQPISRDAGDESAMSAKPRFQERIKHQLKDFSLMFLYLWIVFGMLALHESIVLAQHRISYTAHGLAVVNALVFAKVMLVAEDLRLGHKVHDKPLVYSVVLKSALFAVALICFHIVERVLIGMWDGKSIADSAAEIGVNRLAGIVSLGIIGTIALAPFFVLSEIGRVIGGDKLWALFFQRRRR